ncbi:MAG: HNH endonuclease signature motif containing protein [Polyangiaceae bacterium]
MNDLAQLSDDVLLVSLKRLTGTCNELTAQLLAHLGEVEARGIHRNMACATLYTYCVYELRMSEDEAQRRCRAARLCRQFPVLLAMVADASIHLTGILLLGPHLTDENHREILARARYRTKREIEKLVAEVAPRDDVPARIEPLHIAPRAAAAHATMMAALCGPVRDLPPGNGRGEAPVGALAEIELAAESSVPPPQATPLAAEPPLTPALHYQVQFTADQEYMALLEEARDLLAHVNPTRDFVEVQRKALEVLVSQLRKRKHAARASAAPATTEPSAEPCDNEVAAPAAPSASSSEHSATTPAKRTRRPSAAVARAVWQRDESRCAYVDQRGQRCRETSMLEYHHEHAWALGGATSLDNLSLRCTAHNALAAEEDFGRELMQRKRRGDVETVANE